MISLTAMHYVENYLPKEITKIMKSEKWMNCILQING